MTIFRSQINIFCNKVKNRRRCMCVFVFVFFMLFYYGLSAWNKLMMTMMMMKSKNTIGEYKNTYAGETNLLAGRQALGITKLMIWRSPERCWSAVHDAAAEATASVRRDQSTCADMSNNPRWARTWRGEALTPDRTDTLNISSGVSAVTVLWAAAAVAVTTAAAVSSGVRPTRRRTGWQALQ